MSRAIKRSVYLDNAAAAPIDPNVIKEMNKAANLYGNPSSFNDAGREARKELEKSRHFISRSIGARPEEIVFTSSGSEANSLAILGLASASHTKGEILTSPIEHPSVLETLKKLSQWGWKITYLKVDEDGFIDLDDFKNKLNSDVILVSLIYANNEIGTIQPIKTITKIINDFRKSTNGKNPVFHVDACQATGHLTINVNELGVDLMTVNGAKIYGPRGIGFLYVRKGIVLSPFILGGGQEHGLRAGTENLPAIVGMAKAMGILDKNNSDKIAKLRDYFIDGLKKLGDIKINGPEEKRRLANNINLSFADLDSENILLELDKNNIYASSGSACTARSVEPSHVLKAIGVHEEYLNGAIRFSLGRDTTKNDIDYVLKVLSRIIPELRRRYKK